MNNLAQAQRELQAHIIDGDEAIANAIDSSDAVPATLRLKVYSDAYRLRLIEALEANYPTLAQLLGAESFSRMAQEYLSIYPSRHYSIRWFGHKLAQFLSAHEDYRNKLALRELATWEWCVATAFDASDATVLNTNDLAIVAPESWSTLRFAVHPSMQRVALSTNAVAIVKAASNDEPLPPPTQLEESIEWLIWRQDLIVRYRSLDAAEAAALDAVINGATFEELCAALAEHIEVDQVPLHAASLLKTWITEQCLSALLMV